MSLNEIAYLVADRLPGTTLPALTTVEEIKASIIHWRALLLRRAYSADNTFPQAAQQSLGMVELEHLDPITRKAPIADFEGEQLLRTTLKIPQPIRTRSSGDFIYVGGYGFMTPYTQVSPIERRARKFNRHTADTPSYSYRDGYIEVYDAEVKRILVQAIFQDPREVSRFALCPGVDQYDDTTEFPLPYDLIQSIVEGILKGEYALQRRQTDPAEVDIQPQA